MSQSRETSARRWRLPVARPTVFELVVYTATARPLGLKLAQALLLRADRVLP
jgi:hypothetical protein